MTMNLVAWLLGTAGLVAAPAMGELFHVHNMFAKDRTAFVENEQGQRFLQGVEQAGPPLEVGNRPDINQTINKCNAVGSRMACNVETRVTSRDLSFTDLKVTVNCALDSQVAFDFRRAQSCTCGAEAIPSNGTRKNCPCVVCPDGFGNSPFAIDCRGNEEDPFVIGTCTSLDCSFACNGTCSYDCDFAGPECPFCAPAELPPTNHPTSPPSSRPSVFPSQPPSVGPSSNPSSLPSTTPSLQPSMPPSGSSSLLSSVVSTIASTLLVLLVTVRIF